MARARRVRRSPRHGARARAFWSRSDAWPLFGRALTASALKPHTLVDTLRPAARGCSGGCSWLLRWLLVAALISEMAALITKWLLVAADMTVY